MTIRTRGSVLAGVGVAALLAVSGTGQALGAPADSPSPAPPEAGPTSGPVSGDGDATDPAPDQAMPQPQLPESAAKAPRASAADSGWRTVGSARLRFKPWQARNLPTTPTLDVYSISAVTDRVVWAVTGDGAVWRTKNAGKRWSRSALVDPNLGEVQQVRAVNKKVALAVVTTFVANGTDPSVLWRTKNGGKSWRPVLGQVNPETYLGCIAVASDHRHVVLVGEAPDPSSNRRTAFVSKNGGKKWRLVNPAKGPITVPRNDPYAGESGSCIDGSRGSKMLSLSTTYSNGNGLYVQRVIYGKKWGATWTGAGSTILSQGTPENPLSNVVNKVAIKNKRGGAVGSALFSEADGTNAIPDPSYRSRGKRWLPGGDTAGYMVGVGFVPDKGKVLVATGYNGTRVSKNGGKSWIPTDLLKYTTLSCADKTCWGGGANTQVSRLRFK